ncbi:MAG TPA: AAA family ATPase [Pyrinomonadaceae bacterium]|nr:AAA family ATPase [Pyrinomonadaceae bacterium]
MNQVNPNWVHLRDELELLNHDLLREVRRRAPQGQQGQLDQLQGLVLNEHEIVSFLSHDVGAHMVHDEQRSDPTVRPASQTADELNLRASSQLNQITQLFRLSRVEERCLVLCLAAEIDAGYSKVFAFLQDDITQKQPSIDLALRLFSNDLLQSIENRAIFSPNAPLLKNHLLQLSDANGRHLPYLQLTLKLDERIAAFLLQTPQIERDLLDWVELVMPNDPVSFITPPGEVRDQTIKLVEQCFAEGEAPLRPVIHLYGRPGTGKRSLAVYASRHIGLPLLIANVKRLGADLNGVDAFWRLGRESILLPAVLLIENFDSLLLENKSAELAALLRAVESFSPLTFLSGSQRWTPEAPPQLFLSLECPAPNSTSRMSCWSKHLHEVGSELSAEDLIEISSKFNFTEGQIRQTVEAGRCRAYWENPALPQLNASLLSKAASGVAAPNLGSLARKIDTRDSWSDIVLPEAQLKQLHEIAAHVKRAQVIFEQWGFEKHFSYGRGVTALFEGPSGTGKTMAAGILARELGLDLHKIDLSSVVSKYIGETEKNLERIFSEAQASNAILFFDEADALFGKRSEVKDSHDRYANLEIAFLLQRMEEYSGIVILASNMKQNMDDAFVRRLRFICPFPFPSEQDRELIWQKCFPANAPLGEDVDFRWLARKLNVAGGNIKNISLRAAFLAIDREGVIDMECLIDATKREIEKIGKVFAMAEFRAPARITEVA